MRRASGRATASLALGLAMLSCGARSSLDERCQPTCAGTDDCLARCLCNFGSREECRSSCDVSASHPWLAPGPEPDGEALEQARALLGALNAERIQGGCCGGECFDAAGPLSLEAALVTAAERFVVELSTRTTLDHTGERGDTTFDRVRAAGFRGCLMGENLARGSVSVSEVVRGWMNSEDHCANVRALGFTLAGVAYRNEVKSSSSPVWVLTLGAY